MTERLLMAGMALKADPFAAPKGPRRLTWTMRELRGAMRYGIR